ncbi:uncharacterized protein VTP21DRAFT_9630 [Calcarisporiella thermophila]|uniref:uncharacterized protein n=1 Tax=Calcarisporiella thermophila TaxID=911321 RepID=UPI003744567A
MYYSIHVLYLQLCAILSELSHKALEALQAVQIRTKRKHFNAEWSKEVSVGSGADSTAFASLLPKDKGAPLDLTSNLGSVSGWSWGNVRASQVRIERARMKRGRRVERLGDSLDTVLFAFAIDFTILAFS